ncbi:N-formylglutamate amidohydrolase [Salipiger sp. IMCC34102]|uniref:N-formylglutamate amidohydrolase n=1 Tax=Salipiger sp. IMCC34102 TaxID=2510647 RepID=UPI00101CE2F6|nr:N-formylglutamate amidohydrolase [Salipiger sp. IMCC34102]RYH01527.1 N-formylglutamate amidohydrolase [Salipiger sp. IMCC34102]
MSTTAYQLTRPSATRGAVVFASPHSGREYDARFMQMTRLDPLDLRSSEDAFVDELFSTAPQLGAPLLCARMPRAYLDLNRAADELDPALIAGVRRSGQNPRVTSGLGVVPRVVAGGRAIYDGRIPLAEAHRRIREVWHPYHDRLQTLIDEARRDFGRSILFDCHSMPHAALDHHAGRGPRPQVVIGDRFGAAAAGGIVAAVEQAFARAGLTTARNAPFAGAYITQAYGRPSRGQHVVQIEIDRALYMDERTLEKHDGFEPLCTALRSVVEDLVQIGAPLEGRLAAE